MSSLLIPVILSGGNGSRLWPLSREEYPKQFLKLMGSLSLLQETVLRLNALNCHKPLVIANELHRFVVAEQLREIGQLDSNIILEPVGKNTAPAICLAALISLMKHTDAEPLLLVLAADHAIQDTENFCDVIASSVVLAEQGKLVIYGIKPTHPETGYGYIHSGGVVYSSPLFSANAVQAFVEKPDIITAEEYFSSGEYSWNSGIFMMKASCYIEELKKYRPDILASCQEAVQSENIDLDFIRIDAEKFSQCPDESIDYAIMEKTNNAVVIPMDIGWSDIGSWSSLWDLKLKDESGNVNVGDVVSVDTHDSYIHSESSLVTTLGVSNLVIIQTKDALLVADRNRVQEIKDIVTEIKDSGRHEHRVHQEFFRPWGKYDSIDEGVRYQVKRITVKPGEGLSLQLHHHRAEHWVVVAGVALVTINGCEKLLSENESAYIPVGVKHCLENPGKIPLEIIEIHSGSYLGEDDIIRFSDRYGRT
ncbi:mannose-1-phosphate guanylyltransferase/mannose-6-phosphate isomerase [Kluyvera cryocrescens]|uniref:mannose-1-phosphate guanylyltransferase/mannose-6-phosphate isomerase n=1 Tax=Kluyvera cryocrescens TaxID=580 RepID=UPI000774B556|nr:mannose-1-phosphate guanylyltransferase/mannose-6-phosphate isomerase [Kluyvera cryocrescens]